MPLRQNFQRNLNNLIEFLNDIISPFRLDDEIIDENRIISMLLEE